MFDHNQQVWVQHPPNASGTWYLGNVRSESKSGVVVGMIVDPAKPSVVQEVVVPESFVVGVHPDHLKVWSDMVSMGELHEAAILHNLHQRYKKDQIYVSSFVLPSILFVFLMSLCTLCSNRPILDQ